MPVGMWHPRLETKGKAPFVRSLLDRKLGSASKSACWGVNCLSPTLRTKTDFWRISSFATDRTSILLLNGNLQLWQDSQAVLNMTLAALAPGQGSNIVWHAHGGVKSYL